MHFVLGLASKAEDRLDEAIAAFGRVLQLDPADAGTKIHLGQIHLQQRRYEEALRLFQDALTAEPYNVTAAYNAALALTRAGRAEEGRQAMRRFESLRDSIYGVTYSQSYLAQGRYGEALASTGAEPDLVNPAPPPVTFSNATGDVPAGPVDGSGVRAKPDAPEAAGGVTLFDADNDGDLDLVEIGTAGSRFFRNDGGRLRDETARVLAFPAAEVSGPGAIAGDYDNDGKPDLFLLREGACEAPAPEGGRHVRRHDARRRAAGATARSLDRGVRGRRSRRRPRHRHRRRGRAVAAQQRQRHVHRHHGRRGHRRGRPAPSRAVDCRGRFRQQA